MNAPAEPTRRYVVLHHTGVDVPHFDLMFEIDDHSPLITFRLPAWPIDRGVEVTRLRDHRRVYLDFEGEIPHTGRVDRVAEGRIHVQVTPMGWRLKQAEGLLDCIIERQPDDHERHWLSPESVRA